MAQITSGLRSVLSFSIVYNFFLYCLGAHSGREDFVKRHVRPQNGDRILDIGCGTAQILNNLGEVEYYGFDLSQKYIQTAKDQFGDRATFKCQSVDEANADKLGRFDIVLAQGILHHLGNNEATALLQSKRSGKCIWRGAFVV